MSLFPFNYLDISEFDFNPTLRKKATIQQVATMLATTKHVLFPGHKPPANHRHWWHDTLIITLAGDNKSVRSLIPVVSRWLWPGNGTF